MKTAKTHVGSLLLIVDDCSQLVVMIPYATSSQSLGLGRSANAMVQPAEPDSNQSHKSSKVIMNGLLPL